MDVRELKNGRLSFAEACSGRELRLRLFGKQMLQAKRAK
jgi:hypothetical protein